MARRYPKEAHTFIADNVVGRTAKELTDLVNEKFDLGFTESMMKSYKKNHNLKSGTPTNVPAGQATKLYPKEIQDFIESNYLGIGPTEMTELLNKAFNTNYTIGQIKRYYGNRGINSGVSGRFEKGHVPPQKGKKGCYPPGSEKGWFKKGQTPINHKPVGSERTDTDGYIMVKVAEPRKWVHKHKLIWEAAKGKIPNGYVVTFLDGDRNNTTLDNLTLVTQAESLCITRLGLRSSNSELTKTGILIAKISMARCKIKKDRKKKGDSKGEDTIQGDQIRG